MKKLHLLLLAVLTFAACASAGPYDNWGRFRAITVNTTNSGGGANVTTSQTNFPVLVRLTNTSTATGKNVLDTALANGADIRFTTSDGSTALSYQIDTWSASAAAIWVKVPTVTGNATTTIRMYWKNASATSASSGTAVFDSSNGFRGVWHLNESASPSVDATILNTNASWQNTPATATGNIGAGIRLANPNGIANNASKHLTAAYNAANQNFKSTSALGVTITAWVNRATNNGAAEQGIAGRYNWTTPHRQALLAASSTDWKLWRSTDGTNSGGAEVNFGTSTITSGNWVHLAGTVRNGSQVLYANGVSVGSQTTASLPALDSAWADAAFSIGRMNPQQTGAHQSFDCTVDEVTFSRTARSADWVKLSYETQKATVTAVALGSTTGITLTGFAYSSPTAIYPTGIGITSNVPTFTTGSADSFTVAPVLPAGLTLSKTTGIISGTPSALSPATSYTVTAYNTLGNVTANINIAVVYTAPTSLVYTSETPTYTVGTAITTNSPTVGGPATSFSITPSLPAGLTFNTTTGVITGTPTDTVSLKDYVVTVVNDSGSIKDTLAILVRPAALTAVTYSQNGDLTTADYYVGVPIASNLATVTIAVNPYVVDSFTVSPALPNGLTLDKFTGTISGTPTVAVAYTTYTVTARNVNNSVTRALQLNILAAPSTLSYADENATYEGGLPIAGNWPTTNNTATNYTISPALPSGMTFDVNTGVIAGRAPAAGAGLTAYTLTAINPAGQVSKTVNITVTAAENYSGWANTKTISLNTGVDAAATSAGQGKFPVLVRLTSAHAAVFTASKLTGADIRFSIADGTRLPYQIERWDSAGRKAEIWVGLDTVTPNGLTSFRIHYGNPSAITKSNGGRVFGYQNGYVGVWHMGDTTGILARPNAVFGAPKAIPSNNLNAFGGTYTVRNGAVGLADTLRGAGSRNGPATTSDYFNIGSAADNGTTPWSGNNVYAGYSDFTRGFSYTAWVKPTTPSGTFTYLLELARGSDFNDNVQIFLPNTDGRLLRAELANNTTSGGAKSSSATALDTAVFQQITVTLGTGRFPKWKMYRNGNLLSIGTNDSSSLTARNIIRSNAWMGKSNYGGDNYFRGIIDEPRISTVARSADWAKLEYKNQKPGTTPVFDLAYPTPTMSLSTNGAAIASNIPTILGTATRYVVSPTLPGGLSFNSTNGTISGTPTVVTSATNYTITAYGDSSWSTTASVNIEVELSAPTALSYTPSILTAEAGLPASVLIPQISGGPVATWSTNPTLPAGLTISSSGVISGTPTAAAPTTAYVVSAANGTGAALDTVTITVNASENYAVGWDSLKTFTINTAAAGVTTGQASFPVLVRLTSAHASIFNSAKSDGSDIRFSRPDGTRLSYQIERWNKASSLAEIWVAVDTIVGSGLTPIRIHWGNAAAASKSNGNQVFNRGASFEGIWHFGEAATDTAQDATLNGFDGLVNGTPIDTVGTVGRAKFFNNSNAIFYKMPGTATGPLNFPQNGTYTVSTWVRQVTTAASRTMVTKGDKQYEIGIRNSGTQYEFHEHRVEGDDLTSAPAGVTVLGSWAHVVGVRNGLNQAIYVNGVLATNTIVLDAAVAGARITDSALYVGKNSSGNNRPMLGMIDEVQISSAARSADWIKLAYMSQKAASIPVADLMYSAPSYTFMEEAPITAIPAPTLTGTATRFAISPALPLTLTFNTANGGITGTAADISPTTTYTVTAFVDSSWSTSTTFNLTITAAAPMALNYPLDSIITVVGKDWGSINIPTFTGTISSWTINPALPAGMVLTSTGAIVGIPSGSIARTEFLITGTGPNGSDTETVVISVAPAAETYSTWSGHRSITINTSATGANTATNVLKYPLLVRLGQGESSIFAEALAAGADVRFTKANNLTRLPHETVIWNSTTKTAEIWVQVDSILANNSSQTIRMHWGKVGAADSSSSGQVFNTTNGFVSVWHLGNAADSSARPNAVIGAPPATPVFFGGNSSYTAPAGIIGMADTLRGSAGAAVGNTNHDYISVLNGTPFPGFTGYNNFTNGYTLTAWVRPADVRNFTHFVDMNSDNTINGFNTIYLGRNGTTAQLASRNRTGSTSNGANASANAATDIVSNNATWQYFTASKPNAAVAVTLYKNRTAATTSVVGSNVAIPDSVRKWVYMGKSFDATNAGFAGSLDEIRIANTTRNADWVALDFETQKSAQLVTDIGLAAPTLAYTPDSATYTQGNPISTVTPTVSGINVTYTGSLPAGLALDASTGVITGTPTAPSAKTKYTITATNLGGSVVDSIFIRVNPAAPTGMSYVSNNLTLMVGTAMTPDSVSITSLVDSFTVAPTLPAGLSLNASNGTIIGTPSAVTALANYIITATNVTGTAKDTVTIVVNPAVPNISYATPKVYTLGVIMDTLAPVSIGGTATYAISPSLNAATGLTFNTSTGKITGAPTTLATAADYTIIAMNVSGTDTSIVNITVNAAVPVIAYATPQIYTFGVQIDTTSPVSSGGIVVSYAITPNLTTATGLSFNTATGKITGTPTIETLAANYTIVATNSGGLDTTVVNITINPVIPNIAYATPNVYTVNTPIDTLAPVSSGGLVSSYSITPNLNAATGLNFNTTTGKITGTPTTQTAAANYTIIATNAGGLDTAVVDITINHAAPAIAYATPKFYTFAIPIASLSPVSTGGPVTGYTISPDLTVHTGLVFNSSTGAVTGTPNQAHAATNYSVIATGPGGLDTAVVNITVSNHLPPSVAYADTLVYNKNGVISTVTPDTSGSGPIDSITISPALPVGLALNKTTGVITGNPSSITAAANYTVTAYGPGGNDFEVIRLTVNDAVPVIAYANPAAYRVGTPVTTLNVLSTGGAVIGYSISPNLNTNTGLTFNTTTGAISGTPTTPALATTYTIIATNSGGLDTAKVDITVLIAGPTLAFTPSTFVDTVGSVASHTATTTGSITSCSITPTIPGLSVNATTCAITGTPTTASSSATYAVKVKNSTDSMTVNLTITVLIAKPTIAFTPSTVSDTVGTAATHTPATTGTITSCTIAPAIAGLSVNASTCAITGTPTTTAPSAAYTVTATNSTGSATATLNVTVLIAKPTIAFTPATVSDTVGKAVSHAATTTGTITSCAIAPAIAGLSVNATTCAITGTPTAAAAAANYTVTATNSTGSATATLNVTVLIAAPTNLAYTPDSMTFRKDTAITAWTPTVTGTVTTYSITPALPAGLSLNTTTGAITGTPSAQSLQKSYTVTAANGTGSTTKVIKITVIQEVAIIPEAFVIRVNGQERPYAFQLPAGSSTERLTLSIIDAWGRTIWVKSVNPAKDKMTEISWTGKSANGRQASAGMYIVRISVLNAGTTTNFVRKSVTLKPR